MIHKADIRLSYTCSTFFEENIFITRLIEYVIDGQEQHFIRCFFTPCYKGWRTVWIIGIVSGIVIRYICMNRGARLKDNKFLEVIHTLPIEIPIRYPDQICGITIWMNCIHLITFIEQMSMGPDSKHTYFYRGGVLAMKCLHRICRHEKQISGEKWRNWKKD